MIEDHRAGEQQALPAEKILEEGEFLGGQVEGTPPPRRFPARHIHLEISRFKRRSRLNRRPPGDGPQPREQLLKLEGFAQVVIGAEVETAYALTHGGTSAEHKYGRTRTACAQIAKDIESAAAWEHDVEEYGVVLVGRGHIEALGPIGCDIHSVPLLPEALAKDAGESQIVFNDEYAHSPSLCASG
jgi:hypothetical protein